MTNKISKLILSGFLMLTFAVVACNNDKKDTKTTTEDTVTVKPVDTLPPIDTSKMDTAVTRPVKDPPAPVDPVKDPPTP